MTMQRQARYDYGREKTIARTTTVVRRPIFALPFPYNVSGYWFVSDISNFSKAYNSTVTNIALRGTRVSSGIPLRVNYA